MCVCGGGGVPVRVHVVCLLWHAVAYSYVVIQVDVHLSAGMSICRLMVKIHN